MTASNDRKRAAAMRLVRKGLLTSDLVRKGLLTSDEAAGLTSTPRDLIEYWALREGIDIATIRATHLLRIWRAELMEDSDRPRKKVNAEQMRLHRA